MAGESKGGKLVEATVAKRRTVRVDKKNYGPGETVALPADEVEQLRARGFLDRPGAVAVAEGNGPRFHPESGPSTQQE